ncbi:hypothetical protein RND71_024116 [Anisodus tanguticus]|uniref:Uncharacterized protein n=1 Tax=Anisodus tanguticus TaxID=243964 RepID=A0AAE1RMN1_9SOLA|nr:hypothetical protein RND71_024116 [Anisodus tanguticus]
MILQLLKRKEGQDTKDELHRRKLREELEDRERSHFSSKDSGCEDRDRRKSGQLLLEALTRMMMPTSKVTMRGLYVVPNLYEHAFNKLLFVQTWECLIVFIANEDDDDDEEDDTEALMAELEQIKKLKAEEKLWKSGRGKAVSYPSEYQQSTLLNSKQRKQNC